MTKTVFDCKRRGQKKQTQDDSTYSCEQIVDFQLSSEGQRQYLIKWKDYNEEDNTWEPLANLSYVLEDVLAFEKSRETYISEIEQMWNELYNAGKVQRPLEPFCRKVIEQRIIKNRATVNEVETGERKDNSDSDSDYEFNTQKRRKSVAKPQMPNKKGKFRRSTGNRNQKRRKLIQKNQQNAKRGIQQQKESKRYEGNNENMESLGIDTIVNGIRKEEKNTKANEPAKEIQHNQKKDSLPSDKKEQQVDYSGDQVIVPAQRDRSELFTARIQQSKTLKGKDLQPAIESTIMQNVSKQGRLSNQQSFQSNQKNKKQVRSASLEAQSTQRRANPKSIIDKLIEESRQEIEEIRRKDSALPSSAPIAEGRVNLGGCSNFPVARSIRKYTYIHKRNAEKSIEPREGNGGRDSSVEQGKEDNHPFIVFDRPSPFDRAQDSESNSCLPKSRSEPFAFQKAVQSHSPSELTSQFAPIQFSTPQKQKSQQEESQSASQESEYCSSESKVYSILSHSKSDIGPVLGINDSHEVKIEPSVEKDRNTKPSEVIREAYNYLTSNGIFFTRDSKGQQQSMQVIDLDSDEPIANCKQNKPSVIEDAQKSDTDQVAELKQLQASASHLQPSKLSQQSEVDSFEEYRTPKRRIIAKQYAPSRMSHKERSEESVFLRKSRLSVFSARKQPTPKLTLILDRLISSQLLRYGYRPAINKIVDSFQIDNSRIFEVEMKGNRAFGVLYASYESLKQFYPRKLLKYLEKTGGI